MIRELYRVLLKNPGNVILMHAMADAWELSCCWPKRWRWLAGPDKRGRGAVCRPRPRHKTV